MLPGLGLALILFSGLAVPSALAENKVHYVCASSGLTFSAIYANDGNTVMLEFAGGHRVQLTSAISGSGARFVGGGYELHSKAENALLKRPGEAQINCQEKTVSGKGAGKGPSFSCAANLNPAEQQICTNAKLAQLDRELASAYHALIATLSRAEQAKLKADQRQWLKQRNRCQYDVSCIEAEYYERIAYLNEWDEPGTPAAGGVTFPFAAQSWGGVVRAGPGLNHRRLGSLAEGAPITLLRDTGIVMNGYNWFEIRYGRRTGFQWGGIICPKGQPVRGTYQVCN